MPNAKAKTNEMPQHQYSNAQKNEFQMPNTKCQSKNKRDATTPILKCQMPNAKCQMLNAKCQTPMPTVHYVLLFLPLECELQRSGEAPQALWCDFGTRPRSVPCTHLRSASSGRLSNAAASPWSTTSHGQQNV